METFPKDKMPPRARKKPDGVESSPIEELSRPHGEEGQAPGPGSGQGNPPLSNEDLVQAYEQAQELLAAKVREVEELTSLIGQMEQRGQALSQYTEDEAFFDELRRMFAQDPLAATSLMVQRAKAEIMEQMGSYVHGVLGEHRTYGRLMKKFIEHPDYSFLRPYQEQLEFLVEDLGLRPEHAADFIKSIRARHETDSAKRSAAARNARNRAVLEGGGEVDAAIAEDDEFDKALKNSKTLDEMFSRLNKLRG